MIDKVLTSIFGSKHERDVKRMWPIVNQISALEPEISALSDDGLRAKTIEFRERLRPVVEALDNAKKEIPRDENLIKAAQADLQAALDDLLPEAFAVAREGGKRILNMRHFDVQLMGGVVLHHGKIAEMKTGEGKGRSYAVGARGVPAPVSGASLHAGMRHDANAGRGAAALRSIDAVAARTTCRSARTPLFATTAANAGRATGASVAPEIAPSAMAKRR